MKEMKKKNGRRVRGMALCLTAVMILCLMLFAAGCGDKEVEMAMGETAAAEGRAEITPVNLLVSEKVYPPLSGTFAMGWEADEGKVYAVLEAKLKNLTDKEAKIQDLCRFQMVIGEETYGNTVAAAVTENGSKLDRSKTIGAGKTARVYLITELDADAVSEESSLQMAFPEDDAEPAYNYKLAVDTTKRLAVCEELAKGKTIKAKDLGEITLKKVRFTKKIEPENPGYFYRYFEAREKDEKLLVLDLEVKNLSAKDRAASDFYGMAVVTEDGEEYIGGVAADDANKANITTSETIAKGKSRTTYGIANLPKAAGKGKCTVYIYIDGTWYSYVWEK